MLNKIELKGPTDTKLWAVVVWTNHNPVGSYLYKTRQHAVDRHRSLSTSLSASHQVTLEEIDLVWRAVPNA